MLRVRTSNFASDQSSLHANDAAKQNLEVTSYQNSNLSAGAAELLIFLAITISKILKDDLFQFDSIFDKCQNIW